MDNKLIKLVPSLLAICLTYLLYHYSYSYYTTAIIIIALISIHKTVPVAIYTPFQIIATTSGLYQVAIARQAWFDFCVR